jgi:serine/threonine protein kinase/formylglycine-generating enzyme required for sulfatase activity
VKRVLCYRCGGHVKDGADRCASCGQRLDPGPKSGPAAGFGAGVKKPRHAVEGAPCQPGDSVAGRYQIRDHAGAGPLGWMYRAVEVSTDAEVALKILSPRFLQMPEERRVFTEELRKAQRLAHPNIARIYEAGDDHGRPFIAAQHLEGLTLRRIMDLRRLKGQRFTLQEVEPIVAQIAAALDAASGAFAHGDLKPDNVIVLPELLKLTDFGLAVSLPRAPFMAAQKAAGAHRYLAPEFLLGEPLDPRTDVFSLGVMLGEMLGGARFDAQLNLLEKDPDLPAPVEALFRRAVSARPGARYPSAAEMAAELSELVTAAPLPPPAPRTGVEDAGDVVIVEAQTDPRLRIARALGAARAPDPSTTPQPPAAPSSLAPSPAAPAPLPPAPFTAPPPYEPPPPTRAAAAALQDTQPDRPRRGAGRRGKDKLSIGRLRRPLSAAGGEPAWASISAQPPTEAAVAIGPTTPAFERIEPEAPRLATPARPVRAVAAPPSFGTLEDQHPPRAPLYAAVAVAVLVLGGGSWGLFSSRPPAPEAQPATEPDQAAAAEPDQAAAAELAKAAAAPPAAQGAAQAAAEPAKAEPSKAEPSKARTETPPDDARHRSLRDRVRSVRDRAEIALEERRRQREEALALAQAKREADRRAQGEQKPAAQAAALPAAEAAAQPAPQPMRAPNAPAAQPVSAAPAGALVQPNKPSGAIHGLDDQVMVTKDRASGRRVASAVPAAYGTAAASEIKCPPGMQKVPGGPANVGSDAGDDLRNFGDRALSKVELRPYCIDQYEFPNQPGLLPRVAAAFAEAEALCKNSGKRLCSEDEWETACRGPQDLRFPYGANFDPDACNTQDRKENPRQTTVAGAFSRCKSGYGVWDLSGNAAEWTAGIFDPAGTERAVKGGHAARPGFDDRCASRRKLSPAVHDVKVGFRCCADAR